MTAVRDFAKKPYPCPNPKKNSPPIMTNIHPLFTVQHLQMYIPGFCEQLYNGKCYEDMTLQYNIFKQLLFRQIKSVKKSRRSLTTAYGKST